MFKNNNGMDIYIKSSEAITAQDTFNKTDIFSDTVLHEDNYYKCVSPEFREYIDAKLLRRMSKILKISLTTAVSCLNKANVLQPDAIIVGTGLGCVEDTAKFLIQIAENNEQLLNPTPFIQSTHNTISGQLALLIKCKNYNLTFTQKALSYETALIDALMFLKDNKDVNVLVGGTDEINEEVYELLKNADCEKNNRQKTKFGEGATFFVLSNCKTDDYKVRLKDVLIMNSINRIDDLNEKINELLKKNNLSLNDIDFIVSGSDNSENDNIYDEFYKQFADSSIVKYKHLIGEYDTASGFGMFLANNIIENNKIPEPLIHINKNKNKYQRGIAFNFTKNKDCSVLLMEKC